MHIGYDPNEAWSIDKVMERYRKLSQQLGRTEDFDLQPKSSSQGSKTRVFNIMDSVTDGIEFNDKACIELSVNYIEANVMTSYSGYIRERMARKLRQVELTDNQKQRLATTFIRHLNNRSLYQEYRTYIRLFKSIGIDRFRNQIKPFTCASESYIRQAAEKLLG